MFHIANILRVPYYWLLKHFCFFAILLLVMCQTALAINNHKLLPAEQAFQPELYINDGNIRVHFNIAPGYYLYRNKVKVSSNSGGLFTPAWFVYPGKQKYDKFFGKQEVYYEQLDITLAYKHGKHLKPYELTLSYQGCVEAGICYPPVKNIFTINPNNKNQVQYKLDNPQLPVNKFELKQQSLQERQANLSANSLFQLSRTTLITNLMTFFIAGLGLSLTACMYPLLPIVSAIVVGTKQHSSKWRAFILSFFYVQGLGCTYTIVGIVTAKTGTFLNAWLQQPIVVLSAAAILVVLALSMFDLYYIQIPARWQAFFQHTSNRFHGGHLFSVLLLGAFSALIVGPCAAPPLAFALGYIGQSGDAMLGGMALYVMALGTGVPLILISVFGVHIIPKAGAWMTTIKYAFGLLLFVVATYIATPFLNYTLVIITYTLLMLAPAVYLYWRWKQTVGHLRWFNGLTSLVFLLSAIYFCAASTLHSSTPLHHILTLTPPKAQHFGQKFNNPKQLRSAMQQLFDEDPTKPVLVDFYADWCISCKEMNAFTLTNSKVRNVIDEKRFLQIDVTNNTLAQQKLLHQYGLYSPPGLFIVQSNGYRSKPLLGYVSAKDFLNWHEQHMKKI